MQLRAEYATCHAPLAKEEDDPLILAAIDQMKREDEQRQEQEFDAHYDRLRAAWGGLVASPALDGFRVIRNKVSAHTDLHFVGGKYQLVDIGSLGIKWSDLKDTIFQIQQLVELAALVVRNASFAWESLDRQLTKAASGFWSNSSDKNE